MDNFDNPNRQTATLITQQEYVENYINLISKKLQPLASHSNINKCQSCFLGNWIENHHWDNYFPSRLCREYQFVVQDEVQGFYWTRLQCSIHLVVIYHKDNGELRNMSFCIMSDKTTLVMLLLFMSLKKKNLLTYCKKN